MPGIAVSAAPCAALQPRAVPHSRSAAGFDHTSCPGVDRRRAHAALRVARTVDAEVHLRVVGRDRPTVRPCRCRRWSGTATPVRRPCRDRAAYAMPDFC